MNTVFQLNVAAKTPVIGEAIKEASDNPVTQRTAWVDDVLSAITFVIGA